MTNFSQIIERLEDQNEHSEAAIVWAKWLDEVKTTALSKAFITILEEIKDRHELNGSIAYNDREMRDSIVRDIREILKLVGA